LENTGRNRTKRKEVCFTEQELNDLKNELSQKNKENEQLKTVVDQLQEKSKKGFWQRLFNS